MLKELERIGVTLRLPHPRTFERAGSEDIKVEELSPGTSFAIKPTREAKRIAVDYNAACNATNKESIHLFSTEKKVTIEYRSIAGSLKVYGIHHFPDNQENV